MCALFKLVLFFTGQLLFTLEGNSEKPIGLWTRCLCKSSYKTFPLAKFSEAQYLAASELCYGKAYVIATLKVKYSVHEMGSKVCPWIPLSGQEKLL